MVCIDTQQALEDQLHDRSRILSATIANDPWGIIDGVRTYYAGDCLQQLRTVRQSSKALEHFSRTNHLRLSLQQPSHCKSTRTITSRLSGERYRFETKEHSKSARSVGHSGENLSDPRREASATTFRPQETLKINNLSFFLTVQGELDILTTVGCNKPFGRFFENLFPSQIGF